MPLLDIQKAVESVEDDFFDFRENANPACPVDRTVHSVLDYYLAAARKAMEASLRKVQLSELTEDLEHRQGKT